MLNCIKCQKRKPKREVTVQVEMSGSPSGKPATGDRSSGVQRDAAAASSAEVVKQPATTSSTSTNATTKANQLSVRLREHPLLVNRQPVVTRKADRLDLAKRLPQDVFVRLLLLLDFKARTRLQRVGRMWQAAVLAADVEERRPVWLYVIFRKNHPSGHEKLTVNVSVDGPIFWGKLVAYVYCCSCHFHDHEKTLISLFKRIAPRVERVCMVDNPLQCPFIPDSFFEYMAEHFVKLQFVYLRSIDLENVSLTTTQKFAAHKVLKKLITHGCRKIDVFKDFRQLPQLLDFKGEIQGLKVFLGDIDLDSQPMSVPPGERTTDDQASTSTSISLKMSPDQRTSGIEDDTSPTAAAVANGSGVHEDRPIQQTDVHAVNAQLNGHGVSQEPDGHGVSAQLHGQTAAENRKVGEKSVDAGRLGSLVLTEEEGADQDRSNVTSRNSQKDSAIENDRSSSSMFSDPIDESSPKVDGGR